MGKQHKIRLTPFHEVISSESGSGPFRRGWCSVGRPGVWRLPSMSGAPAAYLLAIFFVAVASILRWAIGYLSEDMLVFAGYYPAVLFATYIGGASVGIFTAVLSTLVGWWAFIPPHFAFALTPGVTTKLTGFLFACVLIIWGADRYRKLLKRFEAEEELRKLATGELAHRLKNKIATIQSVISARLRDDPKTRDTILSLLNSLSATDDLITATQEKGANLRDIFATELGPYDISRVSMQGPEVLLPPKLAITIALVVHELATNAAKYGALTGPVGKLVIRWELSDSSMTINWRESDGPVVVRSNHCGFGTRLLARALKQFDGTIENKFEPSGLICTMNFAVPAEPQPTPAIVTLENSSTVLIPEALIAETAQSTGLQANK
jgi:two-component sensor histidine kinase